MYGLVNTAIRDLIIEAHGEAAWNRVRVRADLRSDTFMSMDPYPDEVTYGLVAAASAELGASPEALLEAFGEYWMRFTGNKGYGQALDFTGADVREFLENLDDMHARLSLSFPELEPPSFEVEEADGGELILHYYSERAGLAPMVVGLLRGVGERFGQSLEIRHLAPSSEADHDRFSIRINEGRSAQAA